MKKLYILIGSLFIAIMPVTAQTFYYKLCRKVIDGVVSENVSGGQFVSFSNNKCYESDRDGYSVENGILEYQRTENGISLYLGESYWGHSVFKFNADKTIMNVIAENGNIYVYKRCITPSNVQTCSLIKPRGRIFLPADVVEVIDEPVNQDDNGCKPVTGHYEEIFEKCSECNGQGFHITKTWMGGTNVSDIKRRCSFCHGKGKIRKSNYVITVD